jgi:hypothetical protein
MKELPGLATQMVQAQGLSPIGVHGLSSLVVVVVGLDSEMTLAHTSLVVMNINLNRYIYITYLSHGPAVVVHVIVNRDSRWFMERNTCGLMTNIVM